MNGYELVEKILGHTNNDVTPLIKFTGNIETEWLEFKAASTPTDGIYHKNENRWDYRLDVSKALFSIANSMGGAVILGVGETEGKDSTIEHVDLIYSGYKGDKDKFMLNLGMHILHPQDGWITGVEGIWRCTEQHNLFSPRWGTFEGKLVIVIMVKPRKKEDGWLSFECENKKQFSSITFCRREGDRGQNVKMVEGDLQQWWKNREINNSGLDKQFQTFLSEWHKAGKHPEEVISKVIQSYLETLKNTVSNEKINTNYIPLFAEKKDDKNNVHVNIRHKEVLTLLDEKSRIVLLGDPGSGKSTCLQQKAFLAAKEWTPNKPWMLFISLSEYTETGIRGLILKHLPSLYWVDIEAQIESGEITLIFDALNECPSVRYDECHQEINGLLQEYKSACFIISSRLSHRPDFVIDNTYDFCSMNRSQQLKFLTGHLTNSEQAEHTLEQLYQQPSAELIAGSPILLKMVADVARNSNDLPKGIAQLYRRFFETWYLREAEKNTENGSPPLWPLNRIKEALAFLAFSMRAEGKTLCSVNFAREKVQVIMGDNVAKFLDRIAQGLLLKIDNDEEFLNFSHETIQEYLVAEYLASHQDALTNELLQDSSGKISNNWAMPLVFSFELIPNPSKSFLRTAWITEPMLVSAALRNEQQLKLLPLTTHKDLWLRGILRAMRGEDAKTETEQLAYISHLPPKYPLPAQLVTALRGTSFWYSAQTHPQGLERLEGLYSLVVDRGAMWMELVPHINNEQLEWKKNLSPAQKVLIGEIKTEEIKVVFDNVTVSELCALLRVKKITKADFIANWKDALLRSNDSQIRTDLISLLRINAKLGRDNIKFSEYDREQKEVLYDIGMNWQLSPRLLNILVRESILTIKDVRDDPGRLEDIVEKMSPMNAFRFMKNGIIKEQDIPKDRLSEILNKMEAKNITELREKGFLSGKEALASRRNKNYAAADLDRKESRDKINEELNYKQWDVTITKIFIDRNFGFVKCPEFKNEIIFWLDKIENPKNKTLFKGGKLTVGIKTQFYSKKNEWGFAVISGRISGQITG